MVKQCLSEFTESMQGTMEKFGEKANVVVETVEHICVECVGTEKEYDHSRRLMQLLSDQKKHPQTLPRRKQMNDTSLKQSKRGYCKIQCQYL